MIQIMTEYHSLVSLLFSLFYGWISKQGVTGVGLGNHGEDGSSPRFLKDPRMVPSSKMRRSRSLQLSSDSIGLEDQAKLNDSQQVVSNDSSPQRRG